MSHRYLYLYLLVLLTACLLTLNANAQQLHQTAPDFSVQHKDGYMIQLGSMKGRYIYLNFWASWCPVSTIQMPNLRALYDKYNRASFADASGNFEIMSISFENDRNTWLKTLNGYGETWKFHCIEPEGYNSLLALNYGITMLPSSFLISPQGEIVLKDPNFGELDAYLSARVITTTTNNSATWTTSQSATTVSGGNAGGYRVMLGIFGQPNFHNFERIAQLGKVSKIDNGNLTETAYIGQFNNYNEAMNVLQHVKNNGYIYAKIDNANEQPVVMQANTTPAPSTNVGISETYVSYTSHKQYSTMPQKTYAPSATTNSATTPLNNTTPPSNRPPTTTPYSTTATTPPSNRPPTTTPYSTTATTPPSNRPTTTTPYSTTATTPPSNRPPTTTPYSTTATTPPSNRPNTTTPYSTTATTPPSNRPPATTTPTPTNSPSPANNTNNTTSDQDNNNVWTFRPNPSNQANTTTSTTPTSNPNPEPTPTTKSTTAPPQTGLTWMEELKKRGLNTEYMKNLPDSKSLKRQQEKLRKKREQLMREVEKIKREEDDIEEQLQFRGLYEQ